MDFFHAQLSCGLDAIAKRYHNCPLTGKANSYCAKKSKRSVSVSVDPLSESVAPPGTAWGAEGLRGNEANENNTMVTRAHLGAQVAKWGWFCTGGQWPAGFAVVIPVHQVRCTAYPQPVVVRKGKAPGKLPGADSAQAPIELVRRSEQS